MFHAKKNIGPTSEHLHKLIIKVANWKIVVATKNQVALMGDYCTAWLRRGAKTLAPAARA